MSDPSVLNELEKNISRLTLDEQLQLIERVIHRIRADVVAKTDLDAELSKMAADPEIQSELKAIDREFSATAQDGLID
jgi:hypothetical protein